MENYSFAGALRQLGYDPVHFEVAGIGVLDNV